MFIEEIPYKKYISYFLIWLDNLYAKFKKAENSKIQFLFLVQLVTFCLDWIGKFNVYKLKFE